MALGGRFYVVDFRLGLQLVDFMWGLYVDQKQGLYDNQE